MQGSTLQGSAPNVSNVARWLWLSFAAVTFAAYLIVVGTGSGDLGLRWIVGFVIVGWPTLAIGATAAFVLTRGDHERTTPSFPVVVAWSLIAWGVAALALEIGTTREYIPASVVWIALPTAVGAAAVLATRARAAHLRPLSGQ